MVDVELSAKYTIDFAREREEIAREVALVIEHTILSFPKHTSATMTRARQAPQ